MKKLEFAAYVPEWIKNPPLVCDAQIKDQPYYWAKELATLETIPGNQKNKDIFYTLTVKEFHKNYQGEMKFFWEQVKVITDTFPKEVKHIESYRTKKNTNVNPHYNPKSGIFWFLNLIATLLKETKSFEDIYLLAKSPRKIRNKLIHKIEKVQSSMSDLYQLNYEENLNITFNIETSFINPHLENSLAEPGTNKTKLEKYLLLSSTSLDILKSDIGYINHVFHNTQSTDEIKLSIACLSIYQCLSDLNNTKISKIDIQTANLLMAIFYPNREVDISTIKVNNMLFKAKKIMISDKTFGDLPTQVEKKSFNFLRSHTGNIDYFLKKLRNLI